MKAALPLVLTALLGLGSGGAVAQIAPGDPAGNQTIPEKDLSRPSEGGTQNGNVTSDGNQSLRDKSGGVVKPAEGVDPQMVQPAPVPDPKSTPVIPPAGTLAVRPGRSPNSCGCMPPSLALWLIPALQPRRQGNPRRTASASVA